MASTDPAAISFGAIGTNPAAVPSLSGSVAPGPINPADLSGGSLGATQPQTADTSLADQAGEAFAAGDYRTAAQLYRNYAAPLAQGPASLELADAYWRLGRTLQFATEFDGAREAFGSANEVFTKLKNEELIKASEMELNHSAHEDTIYKDASANLADDIAKAEVAGDANELGMLHMKWAEFSMHAGAPYGSLHHLNTAARVFDSAGLKNELAGAIFNAGMVLQGLQQPQAAFDCLRHAGGVYQELENIEGLRMTRFVMAQVALGAQQGQVAVDILSELEEELKDSADAHNLANIRAGLTQGYAQLGDAQSAKAKYDLAIQAYTLLGLQENIDELNKFVQFTDSSLEDTGK